MVTHTVERTSTSRHVLLVVLQAVALGLVALAIAALVGEWKFGLAIGAAACLGRLTTMAWHRKT